VNNSNTSFLEIANVFFKFLGSSLEKAIFKETSEKRPELVRRVPNCQYQIPIELLNGVLPKKKAPKRRPPIEKYPECYAQAEKGKIYNNKLIDFAKVRRNEPPVINIKYPNGDSISFRGMSKGSEQYNARLRSKLQRKTDYLKKHYKYFYFLTITYSVADYGADMISAYKLFSKQKARLMKRLHAQFNVHFVSATEATLKGYPHAHIIFCSDNELIPNHEAVKDKTVITEGDLYSYIQKQVASPQFKLQKAGKDGVEYYLVKYIFKGIDTLSKEREKGKKPVMSKDERKALLSNMLPILSQTRQVTYSINDEEQTDEDEDEVMANLTELENLDCTELNKPQATALLRSLFTNSPISCQCDIQMVLDSECKKLLEPYIGFNSTPPPEVLEKIRGKILAISCPGCAIKTFLMKI
jgi:hypothetical protein